MAKLFDMPEDPAAASAAPGRAASTHTVAIAVNAAVWDAYDYAWPADADAPRVGLRVRVPFGRGNRKTVGFVTAIGRPTPDVKLKTVAEVIDTEPQLSPELEQLAEWIGHYYLCPPGLVRAAMVPSAVGKHGPRTETVVRMVGEPENWPSNLGPKQRQVLDELLESRRQGVEPVPLEQLLRHSGAARDSVKRLLQRELVQTESRPVQLPELSDQADQDPFALNDDQAAALQSVQATLGGGFSATLLHGVTGSGKTEVYVRAIRQVIAAGRQAIVLVPEIALATQTLQRLVQRLPRVAVLHSQLTDAQRAFYYNRIREGGADVVVGPRSAVFAPARKLGLIVVDEEHEGTYKQDTAPRYHGRDVAVMRAKLEDVPILLGSATPSLESLHNARAGRYHLLKLPRRVRGLPMPHLNIVPLRQDLKPGRIELLGQTLTHRMAAALDRGEQVILLMNRRGYASYVFCPSCHWTMMCPECTRAMVFHQAIDLAQCHYCQHTDALPQACPACGGKIVLFGYGIQRIENELARKFPAAKLARMDSDTMTSPKQFQQVFDSFSAGQTQILLGTQMVAKGLDFPRVSLVGVVSADTSLTIPDFRASERTFQLIVQVAGRAGRSERAGEVVVQTVFPSEPAIQLAAQHDYAGFAEAELPLREELGYPPFGRMVRFLIRHKDVDKAEAAAEQFMAALSEILGDAPGVRIVPHQQAPVRKIRGQFRFQILLIASEPGLVQKRLRPWMSRLSRDLPAELIADVDPTQLM